VVKQETKRLIMSKDQGDDIGSQEDAYGLKFILENGDAKVFTSLPIAIGRTEQNDILLKNDTVSANHALVYYDEKAKDICIVDLDSLNGVFIDGLPTCRNVLYDGVRINLGTATLIFRDTGFIYPF
jgi:pSer/pThr/pTyr-binding forkhead associated (FHA) protein